MYRNFSKSPRTYNEAHLETSEKSFISLTPGVSFQYTAYIQTAEKHPLMWQDTYLSYNRYLLLTIAIPHKEVRTASVAFMDYSISRDLVPHLKFNFKFFSLKFLEKWLTQEA